jgi:LmeA-like phospholipid-binding
VGRRSMQSAQKRWRLACAALALGLGLLACTMDLGGPAAPGEPIPTSETAAQEILDAWKSAAGASVSTGEIRLIISETQLTSIVAARLAETQDPILRDPQVYLREGQLQVYGTIQQGMFQGKVLLSVSPILNADGTLAFEVTSADLGPVPAPEGIKESLSALVTEAFAGPIGSLATGLRVTSIAIEDGEMALVGKVR